MSELKREEHAISLAVWNARPYVRWETDDIEPVREAYADLSTKGFMTKIAKQWGGYLIARHAPPLGLDKIFAEIRPDQPVFTGPPIKHYHGDSPAPDGLSERHVHSAKNMRHHIVRDKFENDHRGENSQDVHEHHDPAKYVFPPTPRVDKLWFHEHSGYKPEKRADHVKRRHPGVDPDETHSHVSRVKDSERNLAKRIDLHPLALQKFADATTVYFVLEGCVKSDSVLTAGGAVFSVPSVTLWDCDELPRFAASYLRHKVVVIVPDADWASNPLVYTQARLCQTRLRRLGITSHVAAPPAALGLKGVDDLLAAGGTLEDLEVLDRHQGGWSLYYNRNDERARNAEVLVALAMHADPNGRLCVPLRAISRIMDVHVERVARAIRALELGLAITIEGDLTINRKGWVTHSFYSSELDWEERPTIVIAERNRAEDLPPVKLRDFLGKTEVRH